MKKLGSEERGNGLSSIVGKFLGTTGQDLVNNNSASAVADTTRLETEIERSVVHLNELTAEKRKLQSLRAQEIDKKETLNQQIQDLDSQRIEALTAHRIDGGEKDKQRAEDLLRQIEQMRQNMMDATAIADGIERKMVAFGDEIKTADRLYLLNLGKFFDVQMDNLAAEYNGIVPEFARIVTNINALYHVMVQYGAGNSNGCRSHACAPTIKPRDGHTYPAIVDTASVEFDGTARRRATELIEEFKEAGFMSRFDKPRGA